MTAKGPGAARDDIDRIAVYMDAVRKHAATHKLEPALVAAIISRETRGFNVLGDPEVLAGKVHYHGHGLMQIDDQLRRGTGEVRDPEALAWCEAWVKAGRLTGKSWGRFPILEGNEDAAIARGCRILRGKIESVRRLTGLEGRDLLRAAVAAYNTGEGNVRDSVLGNPKKGVSKGRDVDATTEGGDYSVDVLSRVPVFEEAFSDGQCGGSTGSNP